MWPKLAWAVVLLSGPALGQSANPHPDGDIYGVDLLQGERFRTLGCAANSVFVALQLLRPDLDIPFSEIEKDLPLDRLCSGAEIVRALARYPVGARPKRVRLEDAIPPDGQVSIVFVKPEEGNGHWYLIARNAGRVSTFGKGDVYEVRNYDIRYVQDRLRLNQQELEKAGKPNDRSMAVVIQLSREKLVAGRPMLALGGAATIGLAFLLIFRSRKTRLSPTVQ